MASRDYVLKVDTAAQWPQADTVVYADTMLSNSWITSNGNFTDTISVTGDISMNGQSLEDRLSRIEDRLAILQLNPRLEARWKKLKQLGDKYKAMEKDLMEKEKIWGIIKR